MNKATLSALLLIVGVLSGCGKSQDHTPQYRAEATVHIKNSETVPTLAFFAEEVEKVKALGSTLVPDGADLTVSRVRDTRLISIVVAMDDQNTVAAVCNQIAEAYVSNAEDGVKKTLIQMATPPTTTTR